MSTNHIAHDKATLSPSAIEALEHGSIIEAIKLTRTATGMGLKESKACVEAYLLNNPETKEKMDASHVNWNITREHIILLLAAVILFLYWIFKS
ncbi:MAG: hypothetical protein Q7U33_02030 [Methylotenera sp.]|jgi:ribosomal protein L7/L12|uniref:hypothetical protein n=1 Tax=Methylotenera sp. TaxID=2051956 RepID=UPI0027257F53|nr:hypothetical protein [Methylotenera sp.]MDO9150138.1 hypothetical protein [Methylotenera sp.]